MGIKVLNKYNFQWKFNLIYNQPLVVHVEEDSSKRW
jgi:hypothetical protein